MKSRIKIVILFILCVLITPFTAYAQERIVPYDRPQTQLSYAPLVKKVAPAVVNIYTKRTVATGFRSPFMNDPFFERFFGGNNFFGGGGMRERVESALGSGVIVAENGLVVTNAHVVRGAQEITVALADGEEYSATSLITDDASDLALLQLQADGKSFPFVTLKPSESLEVGDLVLAIGNPFGVGQTVTSGIVSAQGRSTLDINDYNFFIQTDAAINPGNSGGALVAMDGGVVGINTAIYSRTGGSMGIGFAIPSEMVVSVIAAAKNGQTGSRGIIRPWMGVTTQNVTSDIASSLAMDKPRGALIADLHTASPLKEAGVKVGDVVVKVNGVVIRDAPEMKFRLATIPIGQSAVATVLRDGKEIDLTVKTIAPPDVPARQETELKGQHILKGAVVANLNPAVAVEIGLSGEEQGVVVLKAPRGYMRAVAVGDVLIEINGAEIKQPSDVDAAFAKTVAGQGVSMTIKRGGRISKVYIR